MAKKLNRAPVNHISERALLVNICVRIPGNTRKDKNLTQEVLHDKGMESDAGKWLKQLYPKNALADLLHIQGEARIYHYSKTLPWTNEGLRILPSALHFEYMEGLRRLQDEFNTAKTTFLSSYDKWTQWAQEKHGPQFNPNDYPGADIVKGKFGFAVGVFPVPHANDFRVDFADEVIDTIKADMEAQMDAALTEARADLWSRLADPVRHMIEKLKVPDGEKGGIFRDSLIGNIREICGLIPVLNVVNDAKLDALNAEVQSVLAGLSPDALRENKQVRDETVTKAEEILARLDKEIAGYGF